VLVCATLVAAAPAENVGLLGLEELLGDKLVTSSAKLETSFSPGAAPRTISSSSSARASTDGDSLLMAWVLLVNRSVWNVDMVAQADLFYSEAMT
jgi:hypothetical protein